MFGYIAINKAEMKFKDYEIYHAYYCGLCKCLSRQYGRRGQLTLSYDMTFLVVLLTSLYEPEEKTEIVRCFAHPFEKHPARINAFSSYGAAVNLILSYYKCMDDWDDERKVRSRIAALFLRSRIHKLDEDCMKKAGVTAALLKRISEAERAGEENLDRMSGLFGEIMAELFAVREDEWEESLRRIGFFLGKFIYLMDAYEDVEKDIASGSYNPLKKQFRENPDFAEDCRRLLTMMMAECCREFEKLPLILHTEILRNVLYSGVWSRYTMVTAKRLKKPERETGADQ